MNPDNVINHELKREVVDQRVIGIIWGFHFKEWVYFPSNGRFGGIIIMRDAKNVEIVESVVGDYSISIKIRPRERKD